jgi:MFS family permease
MQTAKEQQSLTREQKEAVGLLSIGTFLEYFDLMLYVHMAVLLNELFFPKTDPFTASLLTAFAFWSTYLLRPLGALIFGYIGDKIGRKATVVITTLIMSISCITMVLVKPYEEIGITASVIVTICRMLQGMSCVGEISGAELYLTETTKPPIQYSAVTSVTVFAVFGATVALALASYVTSSGGNWRIAFIIGSGVAVIGFVARTALKETPDYVDAKRKAKLMLESCKSSLDNSKIYQKIINEKVDIRTTLSYLSIRCAWPACFYFSFIYCGNLYKTLFGFDAGQVIYQNFIVSIFELFMAIFLLILGRFVYPLKILKTILCIYSLFILCSPYLLDRIQTPLGLFCIQVFSTCFALGIIPASAILYKHFPIFKRFTYTSMLYALSRILMYGVTSFGLIILIKFFGNYGFIILMIPIIIVYSLGISHFQKLEVLAGNY